ncbi:MAG: hypothetical protein J7527_07120 [Chitinophagaceae bacterium]|nr:hypothetical protein [Chitinophagaceae bacterium]
MHPGRSAGHRCYRTVFAECDRVELFLHGAVESFADAIGLWMAYLGFGVINAFDLQLQLIFMVLWLAFAFFTAVL